MKVGLFFGSFNPLHIGHLLIANTFVETTDIQRVLFVVTPQNPFKKLSSLAHEFDRFDMVKAAISDNENFDVSDIEFSLPKPNYTIHTLTYLKSKHPKDEFVLLIGEDNLTHFHKWKNSEIILEDYEVYVYPRPNAKKSDLHDHPKVKLVDLPLIDVSATFIRSAIRENRSIQYLVPKEVEDLIRSRKLYL